MESANATATISTGKLMSTAPTGTKFNGPDSQPSWKISLIAPNEADSDNRFISKDFSGRITEPKARNITTKETRATNRASHGSREMIICWMSTRDAGMPVNRACVPDGDDTDRMSCTMVSACGDIGSMV